MKTMKFECEDRYEAEKLAGLVSVQKEDTMYVERVTTVIGNEIVIKLKDNSSHSVLLKNRENVDRLRSLLLEIASGNMKIRSSDFADSIVEITFG